MKTLGSRVGEAYDLSTVTSQLSSINGLVGPKCLCASGVEEAFVRADSEMLLELPQCTRSSHRG